ncbi:MAG: aerotolerance regulator BatC, partial [Alloprevotella sp.]
RGYIYQKQADTNAKEKQQLLRKAIEEYKNALRLRPNDDGTRYNLALCQKQLRDEQNKQDQQQQQQKQQQQQQSKEEQKDQKQNDQKSPQQQQDNKQEQKDPATEQYLNLSRQAEKRALEKIKNGQPVHRGLDKNW